MQHILDLYHPNYQHMVNQNLVFMLEWHIEKRKIADLKPHPQNPRTLSKDQYNHLKKSIDKFGLIDLPVINLDNTIIGGHQRIQILKKKKIKEVDCWVPNQILDEKDVNELLIRFNRNHGEFNYDILANEFEITDLVEWGFYLEDLHIDIGLNAEEIETEEDNEVLEPAKDEDAFTKLGDIYELNHHRICCGDSTKPDYVLPLIKDDQPILMVTDPPYNLASENSMVACGSNNKMSQKLKDSKWDHDFDINKFTKNIENFLPENISVYIFTSHHLAGKIWEWMKSWSKHNNWCIWKKNNPMPSLMKKHWTWDAELICYATRGKHIFNFPVEGHAHSTFEFSKVSSCNLHPTMKPVNLIEHIIKHSSNKLDIILDPFLGSGTTLIASEQNGRTCYGLELSPAYCDIIVKRWVKWMQKNNKTFTIKKNGIEIKIEDIQ